MPGITNISFGLQIANLLPGLGGLIAFSYWSTYLKNLFTTFLETKSSVGLFLFVISLSLIIGLEIAMVRWIIFEKLLAWMFKADRLQPNEWEQLGNADKRDAFSAAIDAYYRYYQYLGGMTVVIPIFGVGWLRDPICEYLRQNILQGVSLIAILVALEVLTGWAAYASYSTTIQRAQHILKP